MSVAEFTGAANPAGTFRARRELVEKHGLASASKAGECPIDVRRVSLR